ncbi:MAG TPA: DUF4390 domain-containing protein [Orrella sp.]
MTTSGIAHASEQARASVQRIEPLVVSGQLLLDVNLELKLNDRMRQALSRGVPLTFSLELEINAPRWWWFDKSIVDTTLVRRLSYNTLTRIWRVTTGDFSVPAASYEEAIKLLSTVRNWPVVLTDRFEPDETYIGAVRISLDNDQLARPLQMDSARDSWTLGSAWKTFDFSIRRNPSDTSDPGDTEVKQ